MFCISPLAVSKEYIRKVNQSLEASKMRILTKTQSVFIAICITGIIITNSVCWRKFWRFSFGKFCPERISKMFRRGAIAWESLLYASILQILKEYRYKTRYTMCR